MRYNDLWEEVTRFLMKIDPPTDLSEEGLKGYTKVMNSRVESLTKYLCHEFKLGKVPVCGCCGEEI